MALKGMLTENMDKNDESAVYMEDQVMSQDTAYKDGGYTKPFSIPDSRNHEYSRSFDGSSEIESQEMAYNKMNTVCPGCGKHVPYYSKFCRFCGLQLVVKDYSCDEKTSKHTANYDSRMNTEEEIKKKSLNRIDSSSRRKSKIGLIIIIIICFLLGFCFLKQHVSSQTSAVDDEINITYDDLSEEQKHVIDSVYEIHEEWESTFDSGQSFYCKGVTFFEYEGETLFISGIPLSDEDTYESGQTEGGTSLVSGGPISTIICQINEEGDIVELTVDPPTGTRMAITYVLRTYNVDFSEKDKLDVLANEYIKYLQP